MDIIPLSLSEINRTVSISWAHKERKGEGPRTGEGCAPGRGGFGWAVSTPLGSVKMPCTWCCGWLSVNQDSSFLVWQPWALPSQHGTPSLLYRLPTPGHPPVALGQTLDLNWARLSPGGFEGKLGMVGERLLGKVPWKAVRRAYTPSDEPGRQRRTVSKERGGTLEGTGHSRGGNPAPPPSALRPISWSPLSFNPSNVTSPAYNPRISHFPRTYVHFMSVACNIRIWARKIC